MTDTSNFWSPENKPKGDWGPYSAPVRKICQSCFKEYETTDRWSKRCPGCKKRDAPKRKQIFNNTQDQPFKI